jgi:hypothetical protein
MKAANAQTQLAKAESRIDEAALAYLEEHDHFNKLKAAHVAKLEQEKREREKVRKQKEKEQRLMWRKDGDKCLNTVKQEVSFLKFLLIPHKHLKDCFSLMHSYAETPIVLTFLQQTYQRMVLNANIANGKPYKKSQTTLRALKFWLNKEFMTKLNTTIFPPARRFYHPIPAHRLILRRLFRYYASQIHIDKKALNQLRKKRYTYKSAVSKMERIRKTQEACAFIDKCKSIQHYNPKGCSSCGVIFIGGSLDGAVPYVKSVNRDDGTFTLVTLEFELETLAKEEETQVDLLDKVSKDLFQFEEEVYSLVITSLQRWWRTVLLWKRQLRWCRRVEKSLYYYRIRRLVKMKREIDLLIKERPPLDLERLGDKYWDVMRELREYADRQTALKHERVLSFARRFHRTLHVIVEEARERRYQEWLRLQNLPKPPRPLLIKQLRPKVQQEFVCLRIECHLKTFLTAERFEIHMKVHQRQDYLRYFKQRENRLQKQQKTREEGELLRRIGEVKSALQETDSLDPSHHYSSELSYCRESWMDLPHRYNLYRVITQSVYALELISKHSDVLLRSNPTGSNSDNYFLLDHQVTRLGTHPSCECHIELRGEIQRRSMVSKIHCLLYHNSPRQDREDHRDGDGPEEDTGLRGDLTIVDNSSLYGTYVVTADGAVKVPTKVSKGMVVQNGSLLCIGVVQDGPPTLPVVEANMACLVFRLQILAT